MTLSYTLRTADPQAVRCDVRDNTGVATASWYPDRKRLVLVCDTGDHFDAAIKAVTELAEYVRNHRR